MGSEPGRAAEYGNLNVMGMFRQLMLG